MQYTKDLQQETQKSARKSMIATTAIACVLMVAGGDINWAVRISGAWAWFFLLVAHLYFWVTWWSVGGTRDWRKKVRPIFSLYGFRKNVGESTKYDQLFYGLGNVIATAGFTIIIVNLGLRAWESITNTSTPAITP